MRVVCNTMKGYVKVWGSASDAQKMIAYDETLVFLTLKSNYLTLMMMMMMMMMIAQCPTLISGGNGLL